MKEETHERIKRIKGNTFLPMDVLEIDIIYEELLDIKYDNNFNDLVKTSFLDKLETTLLTGDLWKFNPTCIALFVKDGAFRYNRLMLEKDVLENGEIISQEVDIKNNLYTLIYPTKFLLCNVLKLDNELLLKPDYAVVNSAIGEIEI